MTEELARRVVTPEKTDPDPGAPAGTVTDTFPDPVEKPLEVLDKPYLAELFGMGEAYGHFEMEKLTAEIDSFIKDELKRQGARPDRKSYERLVNEYLDRLDLPDSVSIYAKTEKLASLVRINCKLLETLREKEEFLKKDPLSMSSSQLKRYIESKL